MHFAGEATVMIVFSYLFARIFRILTGNYISDFKLTRSVHYTSVLMISYLKEHSHDNCTKKITPKLQD